MGGSNDQSNIVELTPEEHFVAHKLLARMYPDNVKLVYAAHKMCHGRTCNKLYGWLRRRYAEVIANRVVRPETRKKFSDLWSGVGNPMYGKPSPCGMKGKSLSKEAKDKISESNKLKWASDKDRKEMQSQRMLGNSCKSAVKGRKWMVNRATGIALLVASDEIPRLFAEGWEPGRK